MPQHLLRVTRGADAFASLIRALGAAGRRVGWLELAPPSCWPEELEAAAGEGALRAVSIGGGRSVAVKPMRGEPVLRDLLREHFRGCLLVLVRGDVPGEARAAALEPVKQDWLVRPDEATSRTYTTDELIAALNRPHPWFPTPSAAVSSDAEDEPRRKRGRSAPKRRKKRK